MKLKLLLLTILFSVVSWGQTNPAAFALSGGSFTFSSQTATNTTYPTNMQGWTTGTNNIAVLTTAAPGADQALVASGTASTSGLSNLGANGFNFLSTGSSPNQQVGSICVSLNTTGRINELVTWTAADQTSGSTRQMNLTLQYRVGTSGTFTTVAASTYTTSNTAQLAAQTFTNVALPSACDNQAVVQIRWISNESAAQAGGRDAIRLDDITVSSSPNTTPTIVLTPSTLTGFTYVFGSGPSANQTFTASGTNLTANILLTAPTDYEISTAAGSGFGGTVTLTQSGGTVNATIIYTRLKAGLAVASYNSQTVAGTSAGGTTQNVTCSGSVSSASPVLAITGTLAHGSSCPTVAATPITYTITNTGPSIASGVTVVSSGTDSSMFVVSSLSSTSIAANGGTATYVVTFTPTSSGAKTATITVASTTSGSNSPTSSLTGTGTTVATQAVTSTAASSILSTTATLNGNVTTLGVCPTTTSKGFVYSVTSTNANPLNGGAGVTTTGVAGLSTGAYVLALTGLTSGVNYTFKAYVFDGTTYTYGSALNFTTATPPANDLCSGVTNITIDAAAINGVFTAATSTSGNTFTYASTKNDVWYSFTPTCTGNHTITVGFTTGPDIDFDAFATSCPTTGVGTQTSHGTGTTSEIKTASFVAGTTYYIRLIDYNTNASAFTIGITGVATVTPVVASSAASSILSTTATLNGNLTTLGVCPATTSKGFVYAVTSTNANPLNGGTGVTTTAVAGLSTGAYVLALSGLTSSTNYTFKAYVFDGTTYTYGATLTFTTLGTSPTITLAPTTLTGFSYPTGSGPSANQTFTTSGTNLTNDILLTPPADYEISTAAGSGFGSTVTLPQSGGTVSATTIYVRLIAGLIIGSYNSEIIAATSAGATTQNVTCSGSVSSSGPCLSASFDSSTSVPTGWSGTSSNDAVSSHLQSPSNCRALGSSGTLITGAIDNPVSIDFYVDASGSGGQIGTLQYRIGAGAWITIGTFTATTVGATVTFPLTSSPDLSATANVSFKISSASATIYIDDLNAYCNSVAGPTITMTPSTITGFNYIFNSGPSATQTFTASGNNLTADILLTPPTDYEISIASGSGFGSTITLAQTGGVVDATTIYVRLKVGLAVASYNSQNVVVTSAGATTKNATCSGTVSASTNSITSDIIAVASSEATSISSLQNDAAIATTADGVQVWQFTIRDGGTGIDPDALATIVNSISLTQSSNNSINDWSDAIEAVALFNGTTKIADGVVTSTGITFSGGPLISVPDNSSVTLNVRLSIQTNPNNTGGNLDGDDFVFSINHANLVEDIAGSQFKSSGVVSSTDAKNVLSVVGTVLTYTTQPTNTGQNATMTSVQITATDANGNKDLGYMGAISVTSSSTMVSSPLTATAVAGVATFSGIIHTIVGTGYTLSATAIGFSTAISPAFDITSNTTFQPGDLAILAVNTMAAGAGSSEDEISFVTFVDVLAGTTFYLTDNGYERVYAGKWGNTEGIISLTRTTSTLPKGSIITIHTINGGVNEGTDFTVSTCGAIDTNWTKGVGTPATCYFDLNKDDQVWITQGGAWGNTGTGLHDMTYNGNVLFGWTDIAWKTAINYASTKGSTIVKKRECYTTDVANPVTSASQVKFNDPVNPDFSTLTNGKLDWIALISNPANWNYYTSDANYDAGGYNYAGSTTCPALTMATDIYTNGKWTGNKDTNWFNCGNWDTLVVPDETVDVQVGDNTYDRQAIVDSAAAYADYYGNIAQSKNLTITGEKVEIIASANNKLEVHGNLTISSTGALDMDDGNAATADGDLSLYGNWTNTLGNSAFQEGNGTVRFLGSSPQIINNVTPEGTETFYNLVLGNNFDTSVSNDIIALKNLDISTGKTLTIASNDFAEVGYNVTNSGTVNIANNGSLIQTNDAGVDTGNISMQRTATIRTLDYVYWSSPVSNFSVSNVSPSSSLIYKWMPTVDRTASGYASNFGGWAYAGGETMVIGKGYIIRGPNTGTNATTAAPYSATFTNVPNNGIVTVGIERSTWDGADYTYTSGANSLTVKNDDDNYNLLGNPYPSAIDVHSFLVTNANLAGYVKLWSHGTALSSTNGQSFYNSFPYTYTASDYVTYNETGLSAGPTDYAIPAGQGFFVTMNNSSAATSENVTFNNSMRSKTYKNSAFYRQAPRGKIEKHRIWLDILDTSGRTVRTMVGYIQDATLHKDRLFDANIKVDSNLNIYSLINDQAHIIQGRPLPFDSNDKIPLGISTPIKIANSAPSQSTYTIAIGATDGLFRNETQDIYLEDKLLNIIHDLRQAPYTFTTIGGRLDNRFVLRFTSNARLDATDFSKLDSTVVVASGDRKIQIKSYLEQLKSIAVYDILGREVFKKDKVNATEFYVNDIILSQQALIVKIVLANGQTVTRKVIY